MDRVNPSYQYTIQSLMIIKWILFLYINFSKYSIKILDAKIISNENIVSRKVLDLIEHFYFDVDLFSI